MKYRKKPPVVIEAERFWPQIKPWPAGVIEIWPNAFIINTIEGELNVTAGDWIITGIKGERYPCKSDVFWATYEPAWDDDRAT